MEIIDMKGPGKKILTILRGTDCFHLLTYDDGSLGIRMNDVTLSTWEADEQQACFASLLRITGCTDGRRAMVMLQSGASARGDCGVPYLN